MDANTTADAADDSDLRYFISPSQNHKIDIYQLLRTRNGDPSYKVSVNMAHITLLMIGANTGISTETPGSPPRTVTWARF
jgi:hypothetical protein